MPKKKNKATSQDQPFVIPENSIVDPHDKTFKELMSDPRVARDFFDFHLPAEIKKKVDLSTLKPCKEIFRDPSLNIHIIDVLYSADFDGELGYFYLHSEHQSTIDPLIAFRILQYMVNIMDHHIKQFGGNKLPIVYPILFYHGKKKHFTPVDILDLFGNQRGLAEQILTKPYQLVDVSTIPDEKLKDRLWAGIMEFFLKHIFERDFLPYFDNDIIAHLKALEKAGGQNVVVTVLKYTLCEAELSDRTKVYERIQNQFSKETRQKMGTIAQWLEEKGHKEGRQLGIQEGIQKEARKVATSMLKEGFDGKMIAKLTGLSREEIMALQNLVSINA